MHVKIHGAEEEQDTPCAHGHDHGHSHHHHATPDSIASLIDRLPLPTMVCLHARAVYDSIAQAEARAHGCPVGDVHYHEVGALDAVADVTGVCLPSTCSGPTGLWPLPSMWARAACAAPTG